VEPAALGVEPAALGVEPAALPVGRQPEAGRR
jgi:hypothetical protein